MGDNNTWAQSIRDEDPEALENLRNYIMAICLNYLASRRELNRWGPHSIRLLAEEIAQEALLRLRDNIDTFRGDGAWPAWARVITQNLCRTEMKRHRYRDHSLDAIIEMGADLFETSSPRMRPIEYRYEKKETRDWLSKVIRGLPYRARLVLQKIYYDGMKYNEIAEDMGCSYATILRIRESAKTRIRAEMRRKYLTVGDILEALS